MIKTLLINSIVIFLCAHLLKGVTIKSYWTSIGVAIVLAILNFLIRPLIIFFTLPLTVITLGLFILVINAWMLMLADKFVDGFNIQGFGYALVFSILISILNSILFAIF